MLWFSEQTAKTLEEAGVFNSNAFSSLTDNLVKQRILVKIKKYYLNK